MHNEDWSKENPALHLFYCGQALRHLLMIDDAIVTFGSASNMNMLGPQSALMDERAKLVKENAAYAQAEEWLLENYKSLRPALRHYAKARLEEREKAIASGMVSVMEVALSPGDERVIDSSRKVEPFTIASETGEYSPSAVQALFDRGEPATGIAPGDAPVDLDIVGGKPVPLADQFLQEVAPAAAKAMGIGEDVP